MRVHNKSYFTQLFDFDSMRFVNPLVDGVRINELTQNSLEAHIKNCLRMSQRPDAYLPVLSNIRPIPPRTVWEINGDTALQLDKNKFSTWHAKTILNIQEIARRLTKKVDGKIAVELSGGLDTAIIIGVLQSVGLDPTLVGARSNRYEFRTERYVQEKIALTATQVNFIDEEDSLPFANLKSTPTHAIPNKASLFYFLNEVTAKWASKNNYPFVINGIGFDSILIDEVSKPTNEYLFDKINLDDGWANDYVYMPHNVKYVNVASIFCVLKTLITLRSGEQEDTQKLWARNAFKKIIPNELSSYRYKASFGAVYAHGLEKAKSEIMEIFKLSSEVTGLKDLHPSKVATLFNGVLAFDHRAEFEFIARLSYANWIYQLNRSGLILN